MVLSYGVLDIKLCGIGQGIHTRTPITSQAPVSILKAGSHRKIAQDYRRKKGKDHEILRESV